MGSRSKSKKNKTGRSSTDSTLTQQDNDDKKKHDTDSADSNLRTEIESLKKDNDSLQKKLTDVLAENEILKEKLSKWEKRFDQGNLLNSKVQENYMDIEPNSDNEDKAESLKKEPTNLWPKTNVSAPESQWIPGNSEQDLGASWAEEDQPSASGYDENVYRVSEQNKYESNWKGREMRDSQHDNRIEENKSSVTNTFRENKEWGTGNRNTNEEWHDRKEWKTGNKVYQNKGRRYDKRPEDHSGTEQWNNKREDRYSTYDSRKERNHFEYGRNKPQFPRANIIEKDGDLFSAPQDYSLAHCVAADLRMGSGIAVQFKQQFKRVDDLLGQRKKVGEVAVLEEENRYVYYLITKKYSTGKPRLIDLRDSLEKMREHVEENQVKNIAIPRLGCGLDRLHWRDVRDLLNEIFANVDVIITVYNFTVDDGVSSNTPKRPSVYISDKMMKLVDIESETLLVLFGSECGHVDNAMEEIDSKFQFSNEYKRSTKKLGDIVTFVKKNEMICILIVKKHKNDLLSYSALTECLKKLRKVFKDEGYCYMGFTAFIDNDDDLTVAKIVTLLQIIFFNIKSNAWICWPRELENIYQGSINQSRSYD